MLLSLSLFFIYTAFFIFILYRYSLRKSFALSFKEASLAYIVKIIAGCIYGYFFLHYYGGDDTWLYHNEGLKELAVLKTNPLKFITNGIIPEGYKTNQLYTVFNSSESFVKDLELNLLFKLLAIFDLLSGGNYYINIIFYNALVFFGNYFLFKTFSKKYPEKKNLWLIFIFYFPPILFWTSGIRKDGLCFAILCGLIYQLYLIFENKISAKRILYFAFLFMLLFLIRNYIALTFVPVIIACFFYRHKKKNAVLIFSSVLGFCAISFFISSFLHNGFNLPLKMAERQQAFLELQGNSYLVTGKLDGSFSSYIKVLPQALNHVFIRPYISEAKGLLYIFSFLDIAFFFFILIRLFFKPQVNYKTLISDPFILSLIIIALLNYIIIGYTVPFLGAIVRYKASFEILLLLVILTMQKDPLKMLQFKGK